MTSPSSPSSLDSLPAPASASWHSGLSDVSDRDRSDSDARQRRRPQRLGRSARRGRDGTVGSRQRSRSRDHSVESSDHRQSEQHQRPSHVPAGYPAPDSHSDASGSQRAVGRSGQPHAPGRDSGAAASSASSVSSVRLVEPVWKDVSGGRAPPVSVGAVRPLFSPPSGRGGRVVDVVGSRGSDGAFSGQRVFEVSPQRPGDRSVGAYELSTESSEFKVRACVQVCACECVCGFGGAAPSG